MNFKPILFSTEMVRAILEGRKSQTRRIVKPQPKKQGAVDIFCKEGPGSVESCDLTEADMEMDKIYEKCPYGAIGDVLWTRETWCWPDFLGPEERGFIYKASENGKAWEESDPGWKWRPSIFMPKSACRLFLQIKDIRVERLQDISEVDALAEGVDTSKISGDHEHTPVQEYEALWGEINGPESWNSNSWVWVISFERIEKPETFLV